MISEYVRNSDAPRVSCWPAALQKKRSGLRSKVRERQNKLGAFLVRKFKPQFVDYEETKWPSLPRLKESCAPPEVKKTKKATPEDFAAKKRSNNPFEAIAPKEHKESKKAYPRKSKPETIPKLNVAKAPVDSKPKDSLKSKGSSSTSSRVNTTGCARNGKALTTQRAVPKAPKEKKKGFRTKLSKVAEFLGLKSSKASSNRPISSGHPKSQKGRVQGSRDILAAKLTCRRDNVCHLHSRCVRCVDNADHALSVYFYHVSNNKKDARKGIGAEKKSKKEGAAESRKSRHSCKYCRGRVDKKVPDFKEPDSQPRPAKPAPVKKPKIKTQEKTKVLVSLKVSKTKLAGSKISSEAPRPSGKDAALTAACLAFKAPSPSMPKRNVKVPRTQLKPKVTKPQLALIPEEVEHSASPDDWNIGSDPFWDFGPYVTPNANGEDYEHYKREFSMRREWSRQFKGADASFLSLAPKETLSPKAKFVDAEVAPHYLTTTAIEDFETALEEPTRVVAPYSLAVSSTSDAISSSGVAISDSIKADPNPWADSFVEPTPYHAFIASHVPSPSPSPKPVAVPLPVQHDENLQSEEIGGTSPAEGPSKIASPVKLILSPRFHSYRTDECVEGLLDFADDVVKQAAHEFFGVEPEEISKSEALSKEVPQALSENKNEDTLTLDCEVSEPLTPVANAAVEKLLTTITPERSHEAPPKPDVLSLANHQP